MKTIQTIALGLVLFIVIVLAGCRSSHPDTANTIKPELPVSKEEPLPKEAPVPKTDSSYRVSETTTVSYTFDEEFLKFFGTNEVAALEQAFLEQFGPPRPQPPKRIESTWLPMPSDSTRMPPFYYDLIDTRDRY